MRKQYFCFGLLAMLNLSQPAYAVDPAVSNAMAKAEKYARLEKTFTGPVTSEQQNIMDKQCQDGIKQISGLTKSLTAPQLVQLITLAHKKMQQNHYLPYFESVIHFSVKRLGQMASPEAVKALNDASAIVHPDGSMGLVFDEAKERQNKLLQSKAK